MTYNHATHSSEFRAKFKSTVTDEGVMAAIRRGETTCGAIKEAVGGSFNSMERRLTRMAAEGKIEKVRRGGHSYWQIAGVVKSASAKGNKALPRRYEWKPLGAYDIEAHRRLAMVTR